jgi:hypothetical protein
MLLSYSDLNSYISSRMCLQTFYLYASVLLTGQEYSVFSSFAHSKRIHKISVIILVRYYFPFFFHAAMIKKSSNIKQQE